MRCSENLATEGTQVPEWLARPYQLVSLLDMEKFDAEILHRCSAIIGQGAELLHIKETTLFKQMMNSGNEELKKRALAAAENSKEYFFKACESLLRYFEFIGLEFAPMYLKRKVEILTENFSFEAATTVMDELMIHIDNELSRHLFMQIPYGNADYWDKEKLFGENVYENFPSTRNDVIEAGNCYATGRDTACVFHCMRVLEKGLHALVRELNSTFQTNIVFNKEVEFVNWGNIIDKTESEIGKLLKPDRQPRIATSDLQFYSQAAKEFVYFKNAWRDDVSHSRSSYDPNEAKAVIEHVKAFMQHLAGKFHE